MNKTDFDREFNNIKKNLSKINKSNIDDSSEVENITDYANKLHKIAKKMNKEKIDNIGIQDITIKFSRYLYDIIDDISILFSKKKYTIYNKLLKNKRYNNWWIPFINHIRVVFIILTKGSRIMYFGILLVIISILLFFISITK